MQFTIISPFTLNFMGFEHQHLVTFNMELDGLRYSSPAWREGILERANNRHLQQGSRERYRNATRTN